MLIILNASYQWLLQSWQLLPIPKKHQSDQVLRKFSLEHSFTDTSRYSFSTHHTERLVRTCLDIVHIYIIHNTYT